MTNITIEVTIIDYERDIKSKYPHTVIQTTEHNSVNPINYIVLIQLSIDTLYLMLKECDQMHYWLHHKSDDKGFSTNAFFNRLVELTSNDPPKMESMLSFFLERCPEMTDVKYVCYVLLCCSIWTDTKADCKAHPIFNSPACVKLLFKYMGSEQLSLKLLKKFINFGISDIYIEQLRQIGWHFNTDTMYINSHSIIPITDHNLILTYKYLTDNAKLKLATSNHLLTAVSYNNLELADVIAERFEADEKGCRVLDASEYYPKHNWHVKEVVLYAKESVDWIVSHVMNGMFRLSSETVKHFVATSLINDNDYLSEKTIELCKLDTTLDIKYLFNQVELNFITSYPQSIRDELIMSLNKIKTKYCVQ